MLHFLASPLSTLANGQHYCGPRMNDTPEINMVDVTKWHTIAPLTDDNALLAFSGCCPPLAALYYLYRFMLNIHWLCLNE